MKILKDLDFELEKLNSLLKDLKIVLLMILIFNVGYAIYDYLLWYDVLELYLNKN